MKSDFIDYLFAANGKVYSMNSTHFMQCCTICYIHLLSITSVIVVVLAFLTSVSVVQLLKLLLV